jgi:hypothetical protein
MGPFVGDDRNSHWRLAGRPGNFPDPQTEKMVSIKYLIAKTLERGQGGMKFLEKSREPWDDLDMEFFRYVLSAIFLASHGFWLI